MLPIEGVIYPSEADAALYLETGAWLNTTAGDALRSAASHAPDACALVADGARHTYADFDSASERLAAALLDLGLSSGDRAVFQMGSGAETAIALLACAKSGLIPVCALPQHRELEITAIALRTRPQAYFVQGDLGSFDLLAFAGTMAARHGIPHVVTARAGSRHAGHGHAMEGLISAQTEHAARDRLSHIAIDPRDLLMLQLSGGTTSEPKIIPRFHGEFLGMAAAWARRTSMPNGVVTLYALPLIHNAGLVAMLYPAILAAGKTVLMRRMDPAAYFSLVEQERVTHSLSIGPAAMRMLDYADVRRHDCTSLAFLLNFDGSETMERHVGVPCANIYGITEGLILAPELDSPADIRFGSVGWPVNALDQIRLLVPGTEREAEPGEIGELCFRGPSSIRGYYDAPEINRASFTADGFFRTGDLLVSKDLHGRRCYAFEGRIKDNISRGGEKFGAEEVEKLVIRHPDVLDARIVAMPDRLYGERACAFVITRRGATLPSIGELSKFLTGLGLAKFKIPERIESIDAFPLTRVGKVDKAALRELVTRKLKADAVTASLSDSI